MSEKPIAAPEAKRQEADNAEEYLDYFLKAACEPNEQGHISDEVIRATTESILLLHSGGLTFSSKSSEPRDEAIQRINAQKAGMPKSRAEVTDIKEGPLKRFNRAVSMKKGRTSTYLRIDEFRKDALKDSAGLNKVITLTDEGKIIPDIGQFRHDLGAIYSVADYLQARESLDNMEWAAKNTHKYKDSQKYWRGCMVAAARFAGPSTLAVIIEDARDKAGDRLRYLTDQVQKIGKTVGGKAVQAALKAPESREDKAELPSQPQPEGIEEPAEGEFSLQTFIPQNVKEHLVSKYADRAIKVETQVRQGIPRHLAELRVFGAPAVYDASGNIIGLEDLVNQQKPTAEALVNADIRTKPNPALKAGIRRLSGYDRQDDPSNPWHF